MNKLKKYWLRPVCEEASLIHTRFHTPEFATEKMTIAAFLAALAAIFQSMGGLLPGVGFMISPLATAPIVLCCILSLGSGLTAYLLAILLLFFIQPGELIVFPFTTGLLALGIGGGFIYSKTRLSAVTAGSFFLCAGIFFLIYIVRFPVLGPVISSTFTLRTITIIFCFSFFYSWLWVDLCRWLVKKISKVILNSPNHILIEENNKKEG